ncbi:MAG: DNA topoisomerase IB [Candidatus Eremiobacteraeota bacterium]|nr:DNA topoisomerase IB [Candidatus Eremiobacteraeota bacterium]
MNVAESTDAELQAREAGLRYVSDDIPGIRRERFRGKFRYIGSDGRTIRDAATLARIAKLAVPPAYGDVWICPYANGHIQATGRDARGRKQYRYHQRWRETRDATKFEHILEFAAALPRVRQAVSLDLKRPGMPKEKVLAAVVTLLENTLIRVGNEEYARANDSFGLTTLRNRHVRVRGAKLRFEFKGKSGIRHQVDLHDRRLARIVEQCQELPGQHLFSYVDDDGSVMAIDSADVNDYIRNVSQGEFTAKDFRTWLGTVCCAQWLAANPAPETKHRSAMVAAAFKFVAGRLRNTAAVCRKCYVHPSIVQRYVNAGHLDVAPSKLRGNGELQLPERAAVAIVREVAARLERDASQTGIVDSLHRSVRREQKRQRNGIRTARKSGFR